MNVSKEKLVYYYEEAKKYKDDIRQAYNSTFELTDISFNIKDEEKKIKFNERKIDSTILKCQRSLCNFIMSTIFSKTGRWATLKSNLDVIMTLNNTDKAGAELIVKNIDEILEKNSEKVYHTIETTNYYTETFKAISDCVKVGTGIRKVIEQRSSAKPITYAYQNLDNIYILDDAQGKPSIIFKKEVEKNLQDLNDLYGHINGFKNPTELKSEEELSEKINVIEVVIGEYDEKKSKTMYYHAVFTDDFSECLVEEMLEYNPYTVFRWSVDSSNPWGIGIGLSHKDLFLELKEHKEKRALHRDKIVDPPVNFYGKMSLINKVNLKPGTVNYGGMWSDANKVAVQPVNLATNLIEVDKDIADCRQRIEVAYITQPLGDVGDTRNRSATEMQLRMEMFRKEFSGTSELLNTELLEPTFMDAYYILQSKGLLEITENSDYVNHGQIHYVNEMTKSAGRSDVVDVLDFYNMVGVVLPEEQRNLLINTSKFVEMARDKMRIPMDIVPNAEQLDAKIEQQRQLLMIQQMSQVQSRMGVKAETGLTEKINKVGDTLGI